MTDSQCKAKVRKDENYVWGLNVEVQSQEVGGYSCVLSTLQRRVPLSLSAECQVSASHLSSPPDARQRDCHLGGTAHGDEWDMV